MRWLTLLPLLAACAVADEDCLRSYECRQAVTNYNLGMAGAAASAYNATPYYSAGAYPQVTNTVYQGGACRQYLSNGQIVPC